MKITRFVLCFIKTFLQKETSQLGGRARKEKFGTILICKIFYGQLSNERHKSSVKNKHVHLQCYINSWLFRTCHSEKNCWVKSISFWSTKIWNSKIPANSETNLIPILANPGIFDQHMLVKIQVETLLVMPILDYQCIPT